MLPPMELSGTAAIVSGGASGLGEATARELAAAGSAVVIAAASVAGSGAETGQLAYSASRGGIMGRTAPAARALSVMGVRVNPICRGIIDPPIYGPGPASEEFRARLTAPVVFPKRMGT